MKTDNRPQGAAPPRPRGRPRKTQVEIRDGKLYQHQASPIPAAKALAVREPISETQALIEAITKASKDPDVNIEKMEFLLKTRKQLLDDQAEQEFNDAMGRVQDELEPVRKDARNPQTNSKYATLAALDAAIRPFYAREGFALSFDTADHPDPMTIVVVCYVTKGRAKRTYSIPMPCDGKGPKGNDVMTRTHATGSAVSYGRRYLEGMIFNVVIADRTDDDGNRAGYRQPPAYHKGEAIDVPDTPPARAPQDEESPPIGKGQLAALKAIMVRAQVPDEIVLETFKVESLEQLTTAQFIKARNKCNAKLKVMFENEQETSSKAPQNGSPSERAS